ncbi:MAG: NAD(P)-dependent oxidoreductase [Desulfovibrio sp.]|jgi:UDP-glucose 4-epimerase|nr:NAD(P)-dependent oxidoreductase [Desulfovibrio sp.]
MTGKRLLVAGGLGYLGAWLTRRLVRAGQEVIVLSRGRSPLPDLGLPYALIAADLTRERPEELADRLPSRLAGCVHAAGLDDSASSPQRDYPRRSLLLNALGTRNLLEALCLRAERDRAAPPLTLYCSTFHVYGASSGRVHEDLPPAPLGDYGLTHLFAEEYCRLFGRKRGLPWIILRPSNGYGFPLILPSDKWGLLINDLCRMAAAEGSITLRADPNLRRDFVWLGDVAATVETLLSRPDLAGRVFNLSSGRSLRLGEVAALAAETAAAVFGRKIPLRLNSPPALPADMPLLVDNSALREATGLVFASRLGEEMAAILSMLRSLAED